MVSTCCHALSEAQVDVNYVLSVFSRICASPCKENSPTVKVRKLTEWKPPPPSHLFTWPNGFKCQGTTLQQNSTILSFEKRGRPGALFEQSCLTPPKSTAGPFRTAGATPVPPSQPSWASALPAAGRSGPRRCQTKPRCQGSSGENTMVLNTS